MFWVGRVQVRLERLSPSKCEVGQQLKVIPTRGGLNCESMATDPLSLLKTVED